MKIDCNDAINFIENNQGIKLLEFQKEALKGFLNQKNVYILLYVLLYVSHNFWGILENYKYNYKMHSNYM